jgi:hypothetical protein
MDCLRIIRPDAKIGGIVRSQFVASLPLENTLMPTRTVRLLIASIALLVGPPSVAYSTGPSEPFEFVRSLTGRGYPFDGRRPLNTMSDYNGDGIQELAIGQSTSSYAEVAILDGSDGTILRSFRGLDDADSNFIESVSVTPDFDGDGLRDLLVGDSLVFPNNRGRVFSFYTGGPGGSILAPTTLNYEIVGPGPDGGYGNDTAVIGTKAAIAWSDEGRVQLIDALTGASVAKLAGRSSSGFGFSVDAIGDVDGDGFEDWITSDPNVLTGGPGRGEIYVLSGRIETSGADWISIDSLPQGSLIASLHNTGQSNVFLGASREAPFANLGDPDPADAIRQQLLVYGGADGFVAHLMTQNLQGSFTVQQVAFAQGSSSGFVTPRQLQGLGDVNRDGMADFALLDDFGQGKVSVISGAALLDGYQRSDILQTIQPTGDNPIALRSLGDYDSNGSIDLLVGVHVRGSSANVRYDIYSTAIPEPNTATLTVILIAACSAAGMRDKKHSR